MKLKGLKMSKTPQTKRKQPELKGKSEIKKSAKRKPVITALKGTNKILQISTDQEVAIPNPATGQIEVYKHTLVRRVEGDYNYNKLFVMNWIETIGHLGNSLYRVAFWLVENKMKDNMVFAPAKKVANDLKICVKTATVCLKVLKDNNFISSPKGTRGVYILNPDIIYKGGNNDRMAVVTIYQQNKEQVLPAFEEKDETTA